ncbi:MAG: RNA polymerase sigma factor [Actinomycetota bacterium]
MARRSDADLIAESLQDPARFSAVFERHFVSVHRYLSRRAGTDVGDELAAETFAQAFASRSGFDRARTDARPWLFGIATNLLRHHRRAERAQLDAYSRQAGREERRVEPAFDERASMALAVPHVARALRSLRVEDRDVLLLVGWVDLSYGETSEALGIPIGTVRSRLRRARVQMREELESVAEIRGIGVTWAPEEEGSP